MIWELHTPMAPFALHAVSLSLALGWTATGGGHQVNFGFVRGC